MENVDSAPAHLQACPEQAALSHMGGASARGETDVGAQSTIMGTNEGGNRDAQSSTAMAPAISSGRSLVHVPTRGAANVIVVKRDAEDTHQRSKSFVEGVGGRRRVCLRRISALPILELWFRLTFPGVSFSSTRVPMFAWCPLACCARASGICHGQNATVALHGLLSREFRYSDEWFSTCA